MPARMTKPTLLALLLVLLTASLAAAQSWPPPIVWDLGEIPCRAPDPHHIIMTFDPGFRVDNTAAGWVLFDSNHPQTCASSSYEESGQEHRLGKNRCDCEVQAPRGGCIMDTCDPMLRWYMQDNADECVIQMAACTGDYADNSLDARIASFTDPDPPIPCTAAETAIVLSVDYTALNADDPTIELAYGIPGVVGSTKYLVAAPGALDTSIDEPEAHVFPTVCLLNEVEYNVHVILRGQNGSCDPTAAATWVGETENFTMQLENVIPHGGPPIPMMRVTPVNDLLCQ